MGARATALVVGFGAPGDLPAAWAVSCTAGLREEAGLCGAVLVGGDVVEAPQVVISVTALGDLEGRAPVLRSGAAPGDVLAVAGRFGWAAAGLALLMRGFKSPKILVDAHRFPLPPYAAGVAAATAGATSMIDVSDGLVADARHIAEASGVRIDIDTTGWQVPDPLQAAAAAYNVDPREWMLTGGDDHALLATFPAGTSLPEGFVAIGSVHEMDGEPQVTVDGQVRAAAGGHRPSDPTCRSTPPAHPGRPPPPRRCGPVRVRGPGRSSPTARVVTREAPADDVGGASWRSGLQGLATLPALMQAAQAFTRWGVPPILVRIRWMFGFQRRLVRRCECEMLCPKLGPLPQTSQLAATVHSFRKTCSRVDESRQLSAARVKGSRAPFRNPN